MCVCVCVYVFYFYLAACGPKGHGSGLPDSTEFVEVVTNGLRAIFDSPEEPQTPFEALDSALEIVESRQGPDSPAGRLTLPP